MQALVVSGRGVLRVYAGVGTCRGADSAVLGYQPTDQWQIGGVLLPLPQSGLPSSMSRFSLSMSRLLRLPLG